MSKRKRRRGSQGETAPTQDEGGAPRRLLPVDVQQKEFRLAFRGYNEQDVDEFLDQITEELARLHEENKRLTERAEEGGGVGHPGALIEEAQRRAEEIVREAREAANQILDDALPAGARVASAPQEIKTFLGREREFLQALASLIQRHAEVVKNEAQKARSAQETSVRAEEIAPLRPEAAETPAEPERAEAPSEPERRAEEAGVGPATQTPWAAASEPPAREDAWAPEPRENPWAEREPAGQASSGTGWPNAAPIARPQPAPEAGQQDTRAWTPPSREPEPEPEPEPAAEPPARSEVEAEPAAEGRAPWRSPFAEGTRPSSPRPIPVLPEPIVPEPIEPDSFLTRPPVPPRDERPETPPLFTSPPPPPGATGEPRDVLGDVAGAPGSDLAEQTTLDEAPGEPSEGPPEERDEDDRSLRELFWGEE